MDIVCKKEDGKLYIKPGGTLDSNTTGELQAVIDNNLDDTIKEFTLDMIDVDYISSKGLRTLVSAYKDLKGNDMILDNVSNAVYEVLKLTAMLDVFTVNRQ